MADKTPASERTQAHPVPPPAAPPSLGGAVKAALWLLSAEEEVAIGTLKLLSADEVRRLRKAAQTLQKISPDQLAQVHHEFKAIIEHQPLRLRGSLEYLGRLASQAWGDQRAQQLLRPDHEGPPPATVLLEADVDTLAANLLEEHPQIIAAVLTTLTPQRATLLLNRLPEALRNDVLSRLARLKKVPQASLTRAQQILSSGLPVETGHDYDVDGVRLTATLLNQVEKDTAETLLKAMAQDADTLAQSVRQAMFTFEDLAKLDRKGLQTLLKDVPADKLVLSLKAASEQLKTKIFEGLSKRAAEMMKEDLSAMGPTKITDVEAAQKDVVGVAIKLRDEGKITVSGGPGGSGFV